MNVCNNSKTGQTCTVPLNTFLHCKISSHYQNKLSLKFLIRFLIRSCCDSICLPIQFSLKYANQNIIKQGITNTPTRNNTEWIIDHNLVTVEPCSSQPNVTFTLAKADYTKIHHQISSSDKINWFERQLTLHVPFIFSFVLTSPVQFSWTAFLVQKRLMTGEMIGYIIGSKNLL